MFKITDGKGFHITFKNGWTASVQFGYGNYCVNKNNYKTSALSQSKDPMQTVVSLDAEIAAWSTRAKWYLFKEDECVKGYVCAEEVLEFLNEISKK